MSSSLYTNYTSIKLYNQNDIKPSGPGGKSEQAPLRFIILTANCPAGQLCHLTLYIVQVSMTTSPHSLLVWSAQSQDCSNVQFVNKAAQHFYMCTGYLYFFLYELSRFIDHFDTFNQLLRFLFIVCHLFSFAYCKYFFKCVFYHLILYMVFLEEQNI